MSKKILVSFDETQVKKMISGLFLPDITNREALVDYFVHMILDNYAAGEPFLLLITNSQIDQVYYPDDTVQVNSDSMYLGSMDKKKSTELGYSEGGWLWAKVLNFTNHKTDCYQISFNYIHNDGSLKDGTYWVNPSAIRKDKVIPDKNRMNFGDIL